MNIYIYICTYTYYIRNYTHMCEYIHMCIFIHVYTHMYACITEHDVCLHVLHAVCGHRSEDSSPAHPRGFGCTGPLHPRHFEPQLALRAQSCDERRDTPEPSFFPRVASIHAGVYVYVYTCYTYLSHVHGHAYVDACLVRMCMSMYFI